jgi:2-dehydro-3-deoxyphosphooctonate aldolase (KDO 8-P synthase)
MTISIKNTILDNDSPFFLVAGPCVIESEKMIMDIARETKTICDELGIFYIFKASYDKANRSSSESFRGPGLEEGLRTLEKVKKEFGLPLLTDVHTEEQARAAAEVVDIIQIPAFLSRQTDLLLAAGKTGIPVNIKKGQFLAPWDMKHAAEKVLSTGNRHVLLTERGASFGYNNLITDIRSLVVMKEMGYPVIFDATHSVQQPGGLGDKSGGNREYVFPLAKAALTVGIAGIFMEVHPDPEKGLSDGPNMVPLKDLPAMLRFLKRLDSLVKEIPL